MLNVGERFHLCQIPTTWSSWRSIKSCKPSIRQYWMDGWMDGLTDRRSCLLSLRLWLTCHWIALTVHLGGPHAAATVVSDAAAAAHANISTCLQGGLAIGSCSFCSQAYQNDSILRFPLSNTAACGHQLNLPSVG